MKIEEITNYQPKIHRTINGFLNLLVDNDFEITKEQVEAILSDANSHLFFAVNDDGAYSGMLTVGIYFSPSGKKAWIEDVVVAEKYRGEGVGRDLTTFAIQFAKDQEADVVMLTSKPTRISANKLYKKVGFEQKETNVYRMMFK